MPEGGKPGQADETFPLDKFAATGGIGSVSGASGGAVGISPILFEPHREPSLESLEHERLIPPAILWPLQDRKHALGSHPDRGPVAARLGEGNQALFVIDDGKYHCMIGRLVGHSPDGCTYSLVGRISLGDFDRLDAGQLSLADAFWHAKDIALCGVYQGEAGASNVIVAERYRRGSDVPGDYLPPSPLVKFPRS